MVVKIYNLFDEAEKNLVEARKNLDACEMFLELLRENIRDSIKESEELIEENEALHKRLEYEQPFDFE